MNKIDQIAILGYGIEGQAMTQYLLKQEFVNLTICDRQSDLTNLPEGVKTKLGPDYLNDLEQFDIIFRSPGISFLKPQLQKVQAKITSQINYFFEHCPGQIIGVTGTKGKGTTSTLIYEILRASGKDAFLGGNIGEPAVGFLDNLSNDSIVVLELSSFQIQDLKNSPQVAVILNITSEHLDYHQDTAEYVAAKRNLIRNQKQNDYLVVNEDYLTSRSFLEETPAGRFSVSTKHGVENGSFIVDQKIIFKLHEEESFICNTDDVALLGPHNLENVLPAVTVGRIMGVETETIKKVVQEFSGLPHRLELVTAKNDIKYYNDSFSTTPETAIAALRSFPDGHTFILLGGSEKHSDFTELGQEIINRLAIPICFGQTQERIKEAILKANPNYPIHLVNNLEEAVAQAERLAQAEEIILLSPACASFDLFKNYKERGRKFRELAKK